MLITIGHNKRVKKRFVNERPRSKKETSSLLLSLF